MPNYKIQRNRRMFRTFFCFNFVIELQSKYIDVLVPKPLEFTSKELYFSNSYNQYFKFSIYFLLRIIIACHM